MKIIEYLFIAIFYISIIIFFVYRHKNKKYGIKNYPRIRKYSLVICATSLILGALAMNFSGDNPDKDYSNSKPTKNYQSKIDKQKSEQAAEDKKGKQQTADLKKKNEAQHLKEYKEELTKIPEKTNNLITKAYIDDSGSEQTTIVLSDQAMNVSDSELKNVAHSAYNSVQAIIDNYKPFPDNSLADKIRITDSSGNLIAKSSFLDEFKFVNK